MTTCREMLERDLLCKREFVQVVVDLHARHDAPTGYAAREKEDRGAMVEEALAELTSEAAEPRRNETCERLTHHGHEDARFDAVSRCLPYMTCHEFLECMEPVMDSIVVEQSAR